jgi:hypothetical protein
MIAKKAFTVTTVKQSNVLLRFIWARLRSEFGRLSWQYTPRKIGRENRIILGFAQIGESYKRYEVFVQYKKSGIVSAIIFELYDEPDAESAIQIARIQNCLNDIDLNKMQFKTMRGSIKVNFLPLIAIGTFCGKYWRVQQFDKGVAEIQILTKSFDEDDAQYEFFRICNDIIDIISSATNCAVVIDMMESDSVSSFVKSNENEYLKDQEWLEDFPIENDFLRLSEETVKFIDMIVRGDIENDCIIRAAHLFHRGLTIYRQMPLFGDVSASLFISSLEAVSLPDSLPGSCTSCGQPTHKISSRVVELGKRYMGDGVTRLLKESYQRRSKYLHVGQLSAAQPLVAKAIPQLDPSATEGCAMPITVGTPNNLMEFVSFIIRSEIRDKARSPISDS